MRCIGTSQEIGVTSAWYEHGCMGSTVVVGGILCYVLLYGERSCRKHQQSLLKVVVLSSHKRRRRTGEGSQSSNMVRVLRWRSLDSPRSYSQARLEDWRLGHLVDRSRHDDVDCGNVFNCFPRCSLKASTTILCFSKHECPENPAF
jgi:hypothetical protein